MSAGILRRGMMSGSALFCCVALLSCVVGPLAGAAEASPSEFVEVAAAGEATLMRREGEQSSLAAVRAHVQGSLVADPSQTGLAAEVADAATDLTPANSSSVTKKTMSETKETKEPQVDCGGHKASRCRLCTVLDPATGKEIKDRGPEWCHGDCTYYEDECHALTSHNLHVARDNRTRGFATTPGPYNSLSSPEITPEDKEIMDEAADRAIQEENYESKMRMSMEVMKEKAKASPWNKFIFIAIMTGTVCLVMQACAAVVALSLYVRGGQQERDSSNTKLLDEQQDSNSAAEGAQM